MAPICQNHPTIRTFPATTLSQPTKLQKTVLSTNLLPARAVAVVPPHSKLPAVEVVRIRAPLCRELLRTPAVVWGRLCRSGTRWWWFPWSRAAAAWRAGSSIINRQADQDHKFLFELKSHFIFCGIFHY